MSHELLLPVALAGAVLAAACVCVRRIFSRPDCCPLRQARASSGLAASFRVYQPSGRLDPAVVEPVGCVRIWLLTRLRCPTSSLCRWDDGAIDVPEDDNVFREQLELSPQEQVRAGTSGAVVCQCLCSDSQPATLRPLSHRSGQRRQEVPQLGQQCSWARRGRRRSSGRPEAVSSVQRLLGRWMQRGSCAPAGAPGCSTLLLYGRSAGQRAAASAIGMWQRGFPASKSAGNRETACCGIGRPPAQAVPPQQHALRSTRRQSCPYASIRR